MWIVGAPWVRRGFVTRSQLGQVLWEKAAKREEAGKEPVLNWNAALLWVSTERPEHSCGGRRMRENWLVSGDSGSQLSSDLFSSSVAWPESSGYRFISLSLTAFPLVQAGTPSVSKASISISSVVGSNVFMKPSDSFRASLIGEILKKNSFLVINFWTSFSWWRGFLSLSSSHL